MNMKNPLALAVVIAAANMVTAQEVPAPRHISGQILATNKPNGQGSYTGWPLLHEKDIAWKKREWRDIDVKDKANGVFRQEKGDQSLINTLVHGVMTGKIKAYRDDRFSQELSENEVALRMKIMADKESAADQRLVSKYQLKEDSLGLRHEDRTEVRIVGIAPMVEQTTVNSITIETTDMPIFWVYYIDALNYLAESPVPGKAGFTWADILESRSFNGNTWRSEIKMFSSRPDSPLVPTNSPQGPVDKQ